MPAVDSLPRRDAPRPASRFQVEEHPAVACAAAPAAGAWDVRAGGLMILAASVYVALIAGLTRSCFVDDAYIGFRCVENLLAGQGLVFNPGQTVEAVTNVGWLLFLTPLALVVPVTFAAKLLGALLIIATAYVAGHIAARVSRPGNVWLAALPVPLLVVTHPDFAIFSLSGMETPLLAVGLCLLAWRAVDERGPLSTALLGALLYLLHPEGVLVYPLGLLLAHGGRRSAWRRPRRAVALFVLTLVIITVARWVCFGDVLPNTFHAKATSASAVFDRAARVLTGANVNISWPFAGLLALPIVAVGCAGLWRAHRGVAAYVIAAVTVGLTFGVYSNEDWTGMGRYFAPYAPLAMVALWRGVLDIGRAVSSSWGRPDWARPTLVAIAGALVLAGMLRTLAPFELSQARRYPGYVLTSTTLVDPACWLRDALPEDAVVASRRIGALGYYSGKRIFDYTFGLPEPVVARLIRTHGGAFHDPRHPALRAIWRAVAPDYLLEDRDVIDTIIASAGGSRKGFEIHGLLYRECRAFPIGDGVDWVLCEYVPDHR